MRRIPSGAFTSGRLGAAAGVSPDTIRHYEKLGLLATPLRTGSGYRLYPASTVSRVATIRSALKAGFSLQELAGIFKERDSGGVPCRRVAAMAAEKVAGLDLQITELNELRGWLSTTLEQWEKRLDRTAPGEPARLLETLTTIEQGPRTRKGKGDAFTHYDGDRTGNVMRSPAEPGRELPHARPVPRFA